MTAVAVPTAHPPDCPCMRCTGFQPGNTVAVKHGAKSVLLNRARAAEIRKQLVDAAPLVTDADGAIFDVAASLLAHSERALLVLEAAQTEQLAAAARGDLVPLDERQSLSRLSQDCRGWFNSATRSLDALGMTPTARARLGLDLVRTEDGLERLMAAGAEIRARAERQGQEVSTPA